MERAVAQAQGRAFAERLVAEPLQHGLDAVERRGPAAWRAVRGDLRGTRRLAQLTRRRAHSLGRVALAVHGGEQQMRRELVLARRQAHLELLVRPLVELRRSTCPGTDSTRQTAEARAEQSLCDQLVEVEGDEGTRCVDL